MITLGGEALDGFADGCAAQGEAFDILFGAQRGFVRLRGGAGELGDVAA